ncbi:MAG: hypothetical protein ACK5NG_10540 [Chthoniobacterales bacterium]
MASLWGWRNRVDSSFIASLIESTPEAVERDLLAHEIVYRDPSTGQLYSREQYLSGNVRKKLKVAETSGPDYARNVTALKAALPEKVGIADIKFGIGATWIPSDVYNSFIENLGVRGIKYVYKTQNGRSEWEI